MPGTKWQNDRRIGHMSLSDRMICRHHLCLRKVSPEDLAVALDVMEESGVDAALHWLGIKRIAVSKLMAMTTRGAGKTLAMRQFMRHRMRVLGLPTGHVFAPRLRRRLYAAVTSSAPLR